MLTQERYQSILSMVNEKSAVTVAELAEMLGISESTVRRDLTALDELGKLKKYSAAQPPSPNQRVFMRTPSVCAKS